MSFDLLVLGVGGQGVVTAVKVITSAALNDGIGVKVGERHGLAQRYGSVEVHLRLGDSWGVIIPQGQGDAELAFDPLEALRGLRYLRDGGVVIVNEHGVPTSSVSLGLTDADQYPSEEEIFRSLEQRAHVFRIDARALAADGRINGVMLGALSSMPEFPISSQSMEAAVKKRIPNSFENFLEGVRAMEKRW